MSEYQEYLKRYAKARQISEAEAEQHIMVQEVRKFYRNQDTYKIGANK